VTKKRRRPKYGRIFISIVVLILIVYFVVKLGYSLFIKEYTTYLVDYGTLNIEYEYNALLIKNEIVVTTNSGGKITYFINEGDLVKKNTNVAEIFNDGSELISEDTTDLEIIQNQVEFDYTVLESDIVNLKDQIIDSIKAQNFQEIPSLKRNLTLKLDKLEKLEGENKFLSNRTNMYSTKEMGTGALKVGQKVILESPADAIISYNLDGFETILTVDNIYDLDYVALMDEPINSISMIKSQIEVSQPAFKLVDQSTFYLAVIIENDEADTFKNMGELSVRINDTLIPGFVYDVFSSGDKSVAVVRVNDYEAYLYDQRKVTCDLIKDNYKGLKIHIDSIVSIEGRIGVYVVDDSRKLKFTPVKVLGYDDAYAVVQNEQFYDKDYGIVRSVSIYDEIIRDGKAYEDGEYIQ